MISIVNLNETLQYADMCLRLNDSSLTDLWHEALFLEATQDLDFSTAITLLVEEELIGLEDEHSVIIDYLLNYEEE